MALRLTETAQAVLAARYLARDGAGEPRETPEDMFRRVAGHVAQSEIPFGGPRTAAAWAERFHDLMVSLAFLPNSPTLINAGQRLGQLSACFVLPVNDSIASIFETLKQAALIHQSGGGTGFNFSRIRPAGDVVRSTKGVSSGPVSFMRVFDLATETIKQGGVRRGANMGLLRLNHPDSLEFIRLKSRPGFSNFNLSVLLDDAFLAALDTGADYALVNPRTGRETGRLPAREIFQVLAEAIHRSGEPGVVFIDQVNEHNPTPKLGPIEATNPCGEQPLLPYESCNLGSLNLALMARGGGVDWDRLGRVTAAAVRFLDDVIDANRFPSARIRKMTLGNRKIGLGVMGLADLFIALGLPYASPAAADLAGEIMAFVQKRAQAASAELARERGSFPNFPGSIFSSLTVGRRNATLTTIAPTGSISLIAGVSSGIEPLFGLALKRRILGGREFVEVHPGLIAALQAAKADRPEILRRIKALGRVGDLDGVPQEIKRLFVTAHEIPWADHLRIQAAFQEHTDNAVSKTVNLPAEAGLEEVGQAIRAAFELRLKGLTLYRDRTRAGQVLSLGAEAPADCGCGRGRPG